MKQPDLANTLEGIAEEGSDLFYKGQIAKEIIQELQRNGGVLTINDFTNHKSDWVTPLSVPYREYTAYNLPPIADPRGDGAAIGY